MENNTFLDLRSVPFHVNQQQVCCAALSNGSPCENPVSCVSGICSNKKCTGRPLNAVCTKNGMCGTNVCTATGTGSQCTKKVAGAVCSANAECASNSCVTGECQCSSKCPFSSKCAQGCTLPATCINLPSQFPDYCGEKKAIGGDCRGANECLSGTCGNGRCTLKTPGAACKSSSECASSSCYDGVCECSTLCVYNPTSCAKGCSLGNTCITLPAPFPDYCGKKRANGEICRGANECLSGTCTNGRCTLKTPAAACKSSSECASNRCVAGVCECSSSCPNDSVSCAQVCLSPSTCIALPDPSADYCGQKKENGEACRGENECLSGSSCIRGICGKTVGGTCVGDIDCISGSCYTSVCDECAESCDYDPVLCQQGCSLPKTCIFVDAPSPYYCDEKKAKGAACSEAVQCESGPCMGGLCVGKIPGAPCKSSSECASSSCSDGVCE